MKSRPLLAPLVPGYRLALALRELELRSGLKKVRRLGWPVVSVGSLSAGGAGKTPLTIALAKALAARGVHVDVLSRGYGRRSTLPLLVDSSGTAQDFGDEPLVIAREAGVHVYVAAERYDAGLLAERYAEGQPQAPRVAQESLGPKVHILDDGFQHRHLARDVDILLLSQSDLNDRLLPAGNLREALHSAKRAHVIAVPADEPEVEAQLKSVGWQGNVWLIRRRMEVPPADEFPDGSIAAFCGIARPEQFFDGLEGGGLKLVARIAFPDHHNYSGADLARIESAARKAGATTLLTTEKDRVRLGVPAGQLPIKTVKLRVEIEDADRELDSLVARISDSSTGQAGAGGSPSTP
ncbi:MAG TPA: tetraacyldisaccharide 4'-kinase [Terracidiphilus sp.]|nr:tetraacyldisaccharide 4'-kinase [Terracidiphilus sp.]